MAILTQKLGIGFRGLDAIMAFLGIAANHGSDWKWNRLFDRLGLAEQEVADRTMHNNLLEEKRLTIQAADENIQRWLLTEAGSNATTDEIEARRKALLFIDDNKIGVTVSSDGASWQKKVLEAFIT